MILTHDDVREIVALLDASPFGELRVETGRFKLTLRRSGQGGWTQESESAAPAVAETSRARPAEVALAPGMIAVRAPMVGTFYRAPKPGAEPFVDVGSKVGPDSVIAILEAMKLMNAVPAGAQGTVSEILAENAAFVEQGQVLMILRPDGA